MLKLHVNLQFVTGQLSIKKRDVEKKIGIQCDLPRFLYEDIKEDADSKIRFYTEFVSFKVFCLFFTTLVSHGAEKLNYSGASLIRTPPFPNSDCPDN